MRQVCRNWGCIREKKRKKEIRLGRKGKREIGGLTEKRKERRNKLGWKERKEIRGWKRDKRAIYTRKNKTRLT